MTIFDVPLIFRSAFRYPGKRKIIFGLLADRQPVEIKDIDPIMAEISASAMTGLDGGFATEQVTIEGLTFREIAVPDPALPWPAYIEAARHSRFGYPVPILEPPETFARIVEARDEVRPPTAPNAVPERLVGDEQKAIVRVSSQAQRLRVVDGRVYAPTDPLAICVEAGKSTGGGYVRVCPAARRLPATCLALVTHFPLHEIAAARDFARRVVDEPALRSYFGDGRPTLEDRTESSGIEVQQQIQVDWKPAFLAQLGRGLGYALMGQEIPSPQVMALRGAIRCAFLESISLDEVIAPRADIEAISANLGTADLSRDDDDPCGFGNSWLRAARALFDLRRSFSDLDSLDIAL